MRDRVQDEMGQIRFDIDRLRALIDHALDNLVGGNDASLRALASVLYERRRRLDELEGITLYTSRGESEPPPS